jgi:hypothetical protein
MSDDLQARCEANEALQMQREKKIDIMVDEMVKRLNREELPMRIHTNPSCVTSRRR